MRANLTMRGPPRGCLGDGRPRQSDRPEPRRREDSAWRVRTGEQGRVTGWLSEVGKEGERAQREPDGHQMDP